MRRRLLSGFLVILLLIETWTPQVYAAEISSQGSEVITETSPSSEEEATVSPSAEPEEEETASPEEAVESPSPDESAVPEISITPSATVEPVATEEPEAIETPEATEVPSELPETTGSPSAIASATPSVMPSATPTPAIEINTARIYSLVRSSGDTSPVSRIEWLRTLVSKFEMTVTSDNYPDNYYTDIDFSYEHYYDVMVATEFGLVDVEAGDALEPDEPATREFAAHSLNICLGYVPDSSTYSFNEAEEVNYPDDIEVAIEHCWFSLEDGYFFPKQAITAAEMEVMVKDAEESIAATTVDSGYDNQYEFKDNVIVLPEETRAELTGENEITIYDCNTALKEGDIFALISDGFPVVKKIKNISEITDGIVVTTESVNTEDAFKSIDIQGNLAADLTAVKTLDSDTVLNYIVGGTAENDWEDGTKYENAEDVGNQQISAVEIVKSYDIPELVRKEYDLGDGVKATISCKITNVRADYSATLSSAYIDVGATATFNCNVSLDVLEALGVSSKITLVKVPVAYVGYMSVTLDLALKGDITLSFVEYISAGVYYSHARGFRLVSNFYKESFTIQAHAEASAGFTAAIGIDWYAVKGSLYAKAGAKAVMDSETYTDGKTPITCTHINAYLYASVGCDISVNLILYQDSWGKSIDIYSQKNSPIKVSQHYEDGWPVSRCTRETEDSESGGIGSGRWKYYTPADSRYSYSGASSGIGSNGEPFTIFDYTLDSDNKATITGYHGNVSALNIPETLDGYTVVGIGDMVFKGNTQLRMVVIPDSVTSIGAGAFGRCVNLSYVKLSNNLKQITAHAFYNCDSLESIEIPKSLVTTYDAYINEFVYNYQDGPFYGCDGLKNVSFQEGSTVIAKGLFANCTGLETITIPDTVTVIKERAFLKCTNLKQVNFSGNLSKIDDMAFAYCGKLTQIELPNSIVRIGAGTFGQCTTLSTVKLSSNLSEICAHAFYNCDSLESIEIPKSLVTTYDAYINEFVYNYQDGPFYGCDGLKNVSFQEGSTVIAKGLFANCTGLETITIPDTVTVIEEKAFFNCKKLKKALLSNTLKRIDKDSFRNCSLLEEIVLPNSINSMGTYTFASCSSLKKATLPATRVNITEGTFKDCTSLSIVEIPESVVNIRKYAFQNTALEELVIPDNAELIEESAFQNCKALESVILGGNIKTIGNSAFRNCDALTQIELPDSLTSIGTYAFAECEVLSEIKLGTGLTTIPSYAFYQCPALAKVKLPYRIATVQGYAFANCTSLTEVTIPRTATSIADTAFSYPAKMTIYGIAGTYAETFANNKGITFVNQEVNATEISLSQSQLTLNSGSSAKLYLTVTPTDFTDVVKWKCSDTSVATVDDAGNVKAIGIGNAKISVSVGSLIKSCQVTVVQPVTSISLNKTSLSLNGGETYQLTASVYPSNANNKELAWISSDENIATVSNDGLVTAWKKGSAVITVAAQDGSGITKSCSITVVSSTFNADTVEEMQSQHPYENNCKDSWIYTVPGAESIEVTFSEDTEVEEDFDFIFIYDGEGNQIGKFTGTELAGKRIEIPGATVRIQLVTDDATNGYGFRVTKISEKKPLVTLQRIALNKDTANLVVGDTEQLMVSYIPANATVESEITWTSDRPEVATVEGGLVTAVGTGSSVITASVDGKKATCIVKVVQSVEEIQLNPSEIEIHVGEKTIISAIILPEGTQPSGNIQWFDYDEDVISLHVKNSESQAEITALTSGTTKICAIVDGKEASCEVTVLPNEITLDYQNGQENGNMKAKPGEIISDLPDELEREGYIFAGWYTEVNGEGELVTSDTIFTDQWKLYAYWIAIEEGMWTAPVGNQTYTGKAIKPEIRVYDGSTLLTLGQDYSISYKNNMNVADVNGAKAPMIIVKGKGQYQGTASVNFNIVPKSIEDVDVTMESFYRTVTSKEQKLVPNVRWGTKTLKKGKDFELSYPEMQTGAYKDAGRYRIEIKGIGNYTGTRSVWLILSEKEKILMNKVSVKKIAAMEWTGNEINPKPEVTYKGVTLKEGNDYELEYEKNVEIGIATIKIVGRGDYSGVKNITFAITGLNLSKAKVTGLNEAVYSADMQEPHPTLMLDGEIFEENVDYNITYSKNRNVGTAQITFSGIGRCSGILKKSFKIKPYDISSHAIQENDIICTYCKGGSKPEITLVINGEELIKDKDYKISYKNNLAVNDGTDSKKMPTITIKGVGNYKGTISKEFVIQSKELGDVTINAEDVVFQNKKNKWQSKPVLVDKDGKKLSAGKDYDKNIIYAYADDAIMQDGTTRSKGSIVGKDDIPNSGTRIQVTVTGINNYAKTTTATYTIVPASVAKASVKISNQIYTGKEIILKKDDIEVKVNKKILSQDEFEIVSGSYNNNLKKGTASVMIRGTGNYGGTKVVKFKIVSKSIIWRK